jgi:hypothetical protein
MSSRVASATIIHASAFWSISSRLRNLSVYGPQGLKDLSQPSGKFAGFGSDEVGPF